MNSNPEGLFCSEYFLRDYKSHKKYFIGIDSDGSVFDSMDIKQKECFCPHFVNYFGLQPIIEYADEAWEYVNLYSKTRGINRFKALILALDLLSKRNEVKTSGIEIPQLPALRNWVKKETKLNDITLKNEIGRNPHPDLLLTLRWSLNINETVKEKVRHIPVFQNAEDALKIMKKHADVAVISHTPTEALRREWSEQNIDIYTKIIAGQEIGTKAAFIKAVSYSQYKKGNILMIGDAPGDYNAAKESGALFFPIIPNNEAASWKDFINVAFVKFLNGTYDNNYEKDLIEIFDKSLLKNPPWEE